MDLDNEEKLDSMCPKCRDKAMDKSKCSVCGVNVEESSVHSNPKFNPNRFEELDDDVITTSFDNSKFKLRSE